VIASLLPNGVWPEPVLWALRWALFLGPLFAAAWLLRREASQRRRVGALFATLYGVGTIFVAHQVALAAGWWRYGGDALMLAGMPFDLLLGGALLFGPVLFLAAPRANPFLLCGLILTCLHLPLFSSLRPFVETGESWLVGVIFVFLVAHVPALVLAQWTAEDRRLGPRVALLAFGYGWLAFGLLPTLIMRAMGGSWGDLPGSPWQLALAVTVAAPLLLMGVTGAQLFAVRGGGTPIPLDPTVRLVQSGIYAYIRNPMQTCTAAVWIVLGAALGNVWIAAAAGMALVFVLGMVRWHHRHDLLERFPEGWTAYKDAVPEWWPRWRPWVPVPARLEYSADVPWQRRAMAWLAPRATGLEIRRAEGLRYLDGTHAATGPAALAWALGHVNLATALLGASLLLVLALRPEPAQAGTRRERSRA
jgi:protein-S-isoprenylcysteine O-methyltransferase Ste14